MIMPVPNVSCFKGFSRHGDLKVVSPKYLVKLLAPYADFLKSRGLNIHRQGLKACHMDYAALADILMTPDSNMPSGLVDSLQIVHEMATPEAMDYLLHEAGTRGVPLDDPTFSPADLAVHVLLHDKNIIERAYAQRFLIRPCTFVYFQARDRRGVEFRGLSPDIIRALERDLNKWFQKAKRGRSCRVFVYPRQDGIWFQVWHGAPLRREGCIDHGESSCICYRPERYDVLIYQPATGELQMDAEAVNEREVYRRYFGRHFFGDDHHFPGAAIYTLDPLRTDGERALVCSDVNGMEFVTLRRVEFVISGAFGTIETVEADDVFAAINAGEARIPHNARLSEGGFSIKFSDSRMPRFVALRPENMVRYQRDSDCGIVETWFRLRGFMRNSRSIFALLLSFIYFWIQDGGAI
ncbi:MAG: hypothetical protein ABFD49_07210 [Armatimonadota bacterium]|nr:hypothetical protein [bacterium]